MDLIIKEKSNSPTICLNMIVKNEAHIIKKTLKNICDNVPITYWVISDTGSKDDTQKIIQTFFDNKGIKGELFNDEWKDFGHNRTLALQHAFNKTDYIFIFDADDYIHGSFTLPELIADSYEFKFGNDIIYKRPILINNKLKWHYIGVLHEYISCSSKIETKIVDGKYYIESGRTGGRHKDPDCYKKDAKILEDAYWTEVANSNIGLARRYAFYCAQSYKDIGDLTNALRYYKEHIQYNGWNQEKFYSYLQIGYIYYNLNKIHEAHDAFKTGYQICPTRSETLYELCKYYRNNGNFELANIYYLIGQNIPFDPNGLFCRQDIYDYLFDYEFFVFFYYINNKKLYSTEKIHQIFYKLLKNTYITENVLSNYKFYILSLNNIAKKIPITIETLPGFVSSTPSIVKYEDSYYINIRLTNVKLSGNSYQLQHKNEVTNNALIKTTHNFEIIESFMLENSSDMIEVENSNKLFYGIQDIRLHYFNDALYFTGVVSLMENDKRLIQVCYGEFDINNKKLNKTTLKSPNNRTCEKNWVLFNTEDTLYCIYEWFPLTIGTIEGDQFCTTKKIQTSPIFKLIRGSSCGYSILEEKEIWFVCHIVSHEDVRHYMHVIVILNSDTFEVKHISQPFKFENSPVEYCLGIIVKNEDIIMSYSTNDATSNIMVINRKELKIFDIEIL